MNGQHKQALPDVQAWSFEQFHQQRINTSSTAIVLKSNLDLGSTVTVNINEQFVQVPLDHDAPAYTYFLSYPKEIRTVEVRNENVIQVFLINSGEAPNQSELDQSNRYQDCDFQFNATPQSSWREGLAPPDYSRSFTNVTHLIVHHSAGSNSNSNYTQVVRDIYLYHTQVNGWSDIGYNYLVAQDGTIFTGRDPAEGEQDNVRGAHFCGSNSNTMGICLLGNYELVTPSPSVLNSLKQILAFKSQKENLDPTGSANQTLGFLPNIAGHRDGCSTLCPGQNVYSQLVSIRDEVADVLDDCNGEKYLLDFTVDNTNPEVGETIQFTNESIGYDSYQWHFESGEPKEADWIAGGFVSFTQSGEKEVRLIGLSPTRQDTLRKEGLIDVNQESIFPTLIDSFSDVIYLPEPIFSYYTIQLVDIYGQVLALPSNSQGGYCALPPSIANGIYSLRITNNLSQTTTTRIMIKR